MLNQRYQPPIQVPEEKFLLFPHDISWCWISEYDDVVQYGDVPWEYGPAHNPLAWPGEYVTCLDIPNGKFEVVRTGMNLFGNVYLLRIPNGCHQTSPDYFLLVAQESDIRVAS